jgi:hypothetical protein
MMLGSYTSSRQLQQHHPPHSQPIYHTYVNQRVYSHMLHRTIYSNDNITKFPTTNAISPYPRVFKITNKPITPIFILHMYMTTHLEDLHLLQTIQDQIQILITNYISHQIITVDDFNNDLSLIRRTINGTKAHPTQDDHDWPNSHKTLASTP